MPLHEPVDERLSERPMSDRRAVRSAEAGAPGQCCALPAGRRVAHPERPTRPELGPPAERPRALYELLYTSQARWPMDTAELTALLEQSHSFNAKHGITGLLVYHRQEFMQLLEGDEAEVKALFERICRDRRNRQVFVMWEGPLAARGCNDWCMAFVAPDDAELIGLPGFVDLRADSLMDQGLALTSGRRLVRRLRDDFLSQAFGT